MSAILEGTFSRPTTPSAHQQHRRPPLPLAESVTTPNRNGHLSSTLSRDSYKAATPGSSSGASKAVARRLHDLESKLWQTDQKLCDAQSKLTSCNLELARHRAAAEAHAQEMSYTQRLLEREQRDRAKLDGELAAAKDSLRTAKQTSAILRANAYPPGSTEPQSEQVLLLKSQLEESQERARAFGTEVEQQRDELAKLKAALHARGEAVSGRLPTHAAAHRSAAAWLRMRIRLLCAC